MATPVKEKTPLELRAERLLDESMRYSSDEEDEGLRQANTNRGHVRHVVRVRMVFR